MVLNDAQLKAIAYVPKIPASLSIIGSSFIAYLVLRNPKSEPRTVYHRLLLGMSLCDICSSTAQFFGTWAIPVGTPMVWGASGTTATCTAQGAFAQFSTASIVYNGTLALYYFLTIIKGWKADRFARIEPYLHVHALLWGIATMIPMAALGYMNPVGWDCWIAPHPAGCLESYKNNGVTTCERGDGASIFQIAFYFAPLWLIGGFITCVMAYIIYHVKTQEAKMLRYRQVSQAALDSSAEPSQERGSAQRSVKKLSSDFLKLRKTTLSSETQENYKRTIAFAWQAFFYVLSFYYSFLWATIFHIWDSHGTFEPDAFFALFFMVVITIPAQGFFNMLIFLRPRYISFRKHCPNDFFLFAWFKMLAYEFSTSKRPTASTRAVTSTYKSKSSQDITGSTSHLVEGENNGEEQQA